ncbi:phytanoyl-CoA dioxygenase family protein [Limibacter armeniacum]|uniref:phytanoyl-CoA dioxygenase family protein n=1 Tax=Limibacter armeniacum TaxID=466084 RepID=UPI002FE57038
MDNTETRSILDTPFFLSTETVEQFHENGWVKLDNIMGQDDLQPYRKAIQAEVSQRQKDFKPLQERDTYGKAFLQIMNLWRSNEVIRQFVMAKRFAGIAAKLLGVEKVRIYHDQALFKEAGGGPTPWHQDQYYWPLDTDKTLTMWMPLVDLNESMGILQFASGSHRHENKEQIAISDQSNHYFDELVHHNAYSISDLKSICAGDATFHYGWTMHYAPGNIGNRMREVMTVIYFADGAKVTQPDHVHKETDLRQWLPGCQAGDLAASPINPVV